MHPALVPGGVAVITGGASGIGLAAARHLAGLGLRTCIADLGGARLEAARDLLLSEGAPENAVMVVPTDVANRAQIEALAERVTSVWGTVNVLMNNAGMQPGSSIFDAEGNWERILDVNTLGPIRGSQVFAPR